MLIGSILILSVLILLFCIVMYRENRALSLTTYTIASDHLPKGADGTTFVMLADLHSNQFGRDNEELIQRIDELAPDFIIIAGDLFIGREYQFDVAYDFLVQLAKKYEIYYSYGNHEQNVELFENQLDKGERQRKKQYEVDTRKIKTFSEYIEKVKSLGIFVLKNEGVTKEYSCSGCLRIFGGVVDLDYFKRFHRPEMNCDYLNTCFGHAGSDDFEILIAHNPMYFDAYAKWGADLVLSGHVHGGMVRLPYLGGAISPQMQIFPKYDAGLFQQKVNEKESFMIVSRGLGNHTLKIRMWNRPELIYVTLYRK